MLAIHRAPDVQSVQFDLECDDFSVPALPGLWLGADYRVTARVLVRDRPDPHLVNEINLHPLCVRVYGSDNVELCECDERRIATQFAAEIEAAFVAAKGGFEAIEWSAKERSV